MRFTLARMVRQLHASNAGPRSMAVRSYENAVEALNGLQSNAKTLQTSIRELQQKSSEEFRLAKQQRFQHIGEYIQRSGLQMDDIDKLSIIHVTGTKGKGSTCAYCDSILHAQGYKTGFFSSPHLIEVRERFRISGDILSKEKFAMHFWTCYDRLMSTKNDHDGRMPPYFRFLTIMAFHVFLHEQVDVAIFEVGIGGQYDCTNIIRSPVVCGVSSLGIDHTRLLGDTIEEIAWNKGGIFKVGTPAVTVPQPTSGLNVLKERAKERQCNLYMTPDLASYDWRGHDLHLGIAGAFQHLNASLALQLCRIWVRNNDKPRHSEGCKGNDIKEAEPFTVSDAEIKGLESCWWPGRDQLIKRPGVSYFLDGAHNSQSIQQCVKWFNKAAKKERQELSGNVSRLLIFNTTGDRNPKTLLQPLMNAGFDCAVFCPNQTKLVTANDDLLNASVSKETVLASCLQNRNAWNQLQIECSDGHSAEGSHVNCTIGVDDNRNYELTGDLCQPSNGWKSDHTIVSAQSDPVIGCSQPELEPSRLHSQNGSCNSEQLVSPAVLFPCVTQALQWVTQGRDKCIPPPMVSLPATPRHLVEADHIQILITGSLHLVGGVLKIIDPHLKGERP